jgi:phospholipid-binding lipoprotein MlaA
MREHRLPAFAHKPSTATQLRRASSPSPHQVERQGGKQIPALALALVLPLLVSGCASVASPSGKATAAQAQAEAHDPWETGNRKVFAFNEAVDGAVVKPVAVAYARVVPEPVRDAMGNFFGNVQDAWSAVNWGLQAEFKRGVGQGARFVVNTTAGLAGLFDVGRHLGLSKSPQDFGQTLGVWGFGMGPYVVLPLLGPSSARDSAALPINALASATPLINGAAGRVALTALDLTSQRSAFLAAEPIINSISLDRYTFLRDAYLQRRSSRRPAGDDKDFELVPAAPAAPSPSASAAPAP